MSRAFVREDDQAAAADALPERALSPHPNFVTPTGLRAIETEVRGLEASMQQARATGDAGALATIARDLRYWSARLATARVVEPRTDPDTVRFGVRVVLGMDDGNERAFRLVGEDEANPPAGLLSWVAPLARELTGCHVGDVVKLQGKDAEILRIES